MALFLKREMKIKHQLLAKQERPHENYIMRALIDKIRYLFTSHSFITEITPACQIDPEVAEGYFTGSISCWDITNRAIPLAFPLTN